MPRQRQRQDGNRLTPRQLEELRQILARKRREIVGTVSDLTNDVAGEMDPNNIGGGLSNLPTHPADQGTDQYMRDLDLDLLGRERDQLSEIDDAIRRIEDGTYGICEETGKPIGLARLRATPWARLSKEAAEKRERQ